MSIIVGRRRDNFTSGTSAPCEGPQFERDRVLAREQQHRDVHDIARRLG